MQPDLSKSYERVLRDKQSALHDIISKGGDSLPKMEQLLDLVDSQFSRVDERWEDLNDAIAVDDDDLISEFYEQYLSELDRVAGLLEVVEDYVGYIDLYQRQRSSDLKRRLDHTRSVCDELEPALYIESVVTPVIWDGPAIVGIGEEKPSEQYLLFIPQNESSPFYDSILGHELGHIAYDAHTVPLSFRRALRELSQRQSSEDARRDFLVTWRQWYQELFCDAAGLLTYGPAYICDFTHLDFTSNPYHIMQNVTAESDIHPPAALRYEFIDRLARDHLPRELYDRTNGFRSQFEDHLAYLTGPDRGRYDSFTANNLVDETYDAITTALDTDLDDLCTELTDPDQSAADPDLKHRIEANRYWLDRAQSGG